MPINMKTSKKGLEQTCNHWQHVLDKHDRDIRRGVIAQAHR